MKAYDHIATIYGSSDFGIVHCLQFSGDGRHLAVASGCTLALLHVQDRRVLAVFPAEFQLTCLCWTDDIFGTLVCAFEDGLIMHLTLKEGKVKLIGHKAAEHRISCMDATEDCSYLATGAEGVVRVWKRMQGGTNAGWTKHSEMSNVNKRVVNQHLLPVIVGLHWQDNTSQLHLLVSYRDHGVQLWDVSSGTPIHVIHESHRSILYTSLSPDLDHILIATEGECEVIEIKKRNVVTGLRNEWDHSLPVVIINGGALLLSGLSATQSAIWNLVAGEDVKLFQKLKHPPDSYGPAGALSSFSDPKTNTWMIAIGLSNQVVLWKATEVEGQGQWNTTNMSKVYQGRYAKCFLTAAVLALAVVGTFCRVQISQLILVLAAQFAARARDLHMKLI